ncbi:hypothetical protein ACFLS9_10885 [Bacteroidota bacterium]
MESYFGVAKEENLTEEEIGTVESIVMAVSAGRVNAQFRVARHNVERKSKRKEK